MEKVDRLHLLRKALTLLPENPRIIETGTIYSLQDNHRMGDGWSSKLIAEHIRDHGGTFYSIDLDISTAEKGFSEWGLRDHVNLLKGNTLEILPQLIDEQKFDLCYLDSDNDPELVLQEFKLLEPHCDLFVIDDVDLAHLTPKRKGDLVVPYARSKEFNVEIVLGHAWQALISSR